MVVRHNCAAWLEAAGARGSSPDLEGIALILRAQDGRPVKEVDRMLRSLPFTHFIPYEVPGERRRVYWIRPGIPYLRDVAGDGLFVEILPQETGAADVVMWWQIGGLDCIDLGGSGQ